MKTRRESSSFRLSNTTLKERKRMHCCERHLGRWFSLPHHSWNTTQAGCLQTGCVSLDFYVSKNLLARISSFMLFLNTNPAGGLSTCYGTHHPTGKEESGSEMPVICLAAIKRSLVDIIASNYCCNASDDSLITVPYRSSAHESRATKIQ